MLRPVSLRRERSQPRHFVGVHVQQAGVRIPGRAAPFGAAVEAGVDSGVDADGERLERAVAAQLRELLARPASPPPGVRVVRSSAVKRWRA